MDRAGCEAKASRGLKPALLFLSLAFAQAQTLRMTAGEAKPVVLARGIVSIQSARVEPTLQFPPVVHADQTGEVHLMIPPATPPGNYRIAITGRTQDGRSATSTLTLTVEGVTISPTGKTPIILMNGWQLSCPPNPDSSVAGSASTFGQLASLLQGDGVP